MDALGHVNNATFFQYCESGRIAYFDKIGLEQFQTKPTDGPGLVAANLNFRQQLRYPGTVRVTTRITSIRNRSFSLSLVLTDAATGEIAADGESVCVWVDYAAGKALPLPEAMIRRIEEIEGRTDLRQS